MDNDTVSLANAKTPAPSDRKSSCNKRKKKGCQKRYRGLTYKYMREYIIYKESPEQVVDVLGKLQDMMVLAACQSSAYRYPVIKQWFLNRYPEIVQFGMPEMKKEEENTPSLIIDEPVSIQELKNAS